MTAVGSFHDAVLGVGEYAKKPTLYERIGGEAAVDAAVKIFYKKVLADTSINHYFSAMDMVAQHKKQKTFLSMVMGGPNEYSGQDMYAAHAGLGLTESDFGAVAGHLQSTLQELNVPSQELGEIMTAVGSFHDAVLGVGKYANGGAGAGAGAGSSGAGVCPFMAPGLHKFRYTKLKLVSREVIPSTTLPVRRLRFEIPNNKCSGVHTGEQVMLAATIDNDFITRRYTPISAMTDTGFLELATKVYPRGRMSQYLNSLRIGATVDVKGPTGHFQYTRGGIAGVSHIGAVCGGIAITSILEVMRVLANNPKDTTKITLLYVNKTAGDILFKDEIDAMAARDDRITVVHCLTKPSASWTGMRGRPTQETMAELLPPPAESTLCIVCGSDAMKAGLKQYALALGHDEMNIRLL